MSNTTVPISEWCKEIRVALARKEMNLQSVADEIGYSYTTITALISGRIVKDNYLDIAKKINEVLEVNVLPEKPQLPGLSQFGLDSATRLHEAGFASNRASEMCIRDSIMMPAIQRYILARYSSQR